MNKIVVISGGSSGLGYELVKMFEEGGDTAVCLSRSVPDGIKNHVYCDVSNQESVISAVKTIGERFGRIDLLINNAGKGISGATELLPVDKIREVMDTDYYGSLYLSRQALPLMGDKGKIVNISSACALFALPFRSVYCSAKAAVNMMSFAMRMELKNTGIKVVCICPGDVKTPFTANRLKFYETNERYGSRIKDAAEKIDTRQDKRMDCKKTAKKLFKICVKKNKALYIVGAKYKMLYFFQKILPANFFIKMTGKLFG